MAIFFCKCICICLNKAYYYKSPYVLLSTAVHTLYESNAAAFILYKVDKGLQFYLHYHTQIYIKKNHYSPLVSLFFLSLEIIHK